MLLEVQIFDLLPARHDASAAADAHVAPHAVEVAVVDGANVLRLVREGSEFVASGVVVVIRHSVGEAADDGFGDVFVRENVSNDTRIAKSRQELRHTFVFWLRGVGIAGDEILVVIRSYRVKVHRTGHVQQDHRVVCGNFRRVDW